MIYIASISLKKNEVAYNKYTIKRKQRLSGGLVALMISLAILTELRLVTDGQTDGHRAIAYRAGVA